MSNPEEQRPTLIPPNFIEKGKILNGTFDIRNAIEAIILALLIGVPVVQLPLSLTTRIIILCMTALPAAMVALIGIGGQSITAFLMNALRFLKNRRIIRRSDVMPEQHKRQKIPRQREEKRPKKKPKKRKEEVKTEDSSRQAEEPAPVERKKKSGVSLTQARSGASGGRPVRTSVI